MLKRFMLVALASVVAATAMAAPAEAEIRLKRKNGYAFFEPYYPGPYDMPPPGYYDEDYYDVYGRPAFDESYYNPYYLPPSNKALKARAEKRKKAKAAAIAAAKEAEAKAKAAKLAKAKKAPAPGDITASTSKINTASLATETPKSASGAVTCEKATSIVSGYGFSTVEATQCAGSTYEFKAVRDGKNFVIKVSSASGELTEVKKLN